MKKNEIQKGIGYLMDLKRRAFDDMENSDYGEKVIKSTYYQEYKSIFSSLVAEIAKQKPSYAKQYDDVTKSEMYYDLKLEEYDGIINAINHEIELGMIVDEGDMSKCNNDQNIILIFEKFHNICRQVRSRYSGRDTLDVKDEYDVQDLLHSLLRLFFNDIRQEEYTPSYAGSSARMDFLLSDIESVIEVKKTRDGLRDKEIGNQLIEDITRYKIHPKCKILYCFVYDPDGFIGNPRGLEKDLSGIKDGLNVIVIIRP